MGSRGRWRGQVHLGEMKLFWCPSCGLPVVGQRICPRCGEETQIVRVTPPGDVRPAFDGDIQIVRKVVERNFGRDAGRSFVKDGEAVFINRAPSTDLHHEVVAGGEVIGSIIYDVLKGEFRLSLREGGAARIIRVAERGVITVDEGAKRAILLEGGSLLQPGVVNVRGGVEEGEEAILVDESGRLFAIGHATRSLPPGSPPGGRGMVVKVRWKSPTPPSPPPPTMMTLREVAEANRLYLGYLEERAVNFIKEVVRKHPQLPVAVSYSGGKDSLATLLLLIESGIKPKVIFINTGLEFPETVNNVREVERRYALEVLEAIPTANFYSEIEHFGPPGRDYRFCCKSLKLGPVVRLIRENFPEGVLSFIGQRRYESRGRMEKGAVWENPWVPGQIGASPIQNWSALEVFLYLILKDAPINPLYRLGLDRIGCWLCPASDMGDLRIIKGRHPDWEKWEGFLRRWAEEMGLPEKAVELGAWRFRRPPRWLRDLAESMGLHLPVDLRRGRWGMLELCEKEGVLTLRRVRDEGRFLNVLKAVGSVVEGGGVITVRSGEGEVVVERKGRGAYTVSGKDTLIRFVKGAVVRSQECVQCGICPGRCPTGALKLGEGGIVIDEGRCVSCHLCLMGPCPAEAYRPSQGFSF